MGRKLKDIHLQQRFMCSQAMIAWVTFSVMMIQPVWADTYNYDMPDNMIVHFRAGEKWMHVGQYAAAVREYQMAIQLKPSTPLTATLYNNLGIAYMKLHEGPKSIVCFQRALAINPNFSIFYENLAKAYQTAGTLPTALREIKHDTHLNPGDAQAWYLLGMLYRENHQPAASQKAFQTFIKIAPYSDLSEAAKEYSK